MQFSNGTLKREQGIYETIQFWIITIDNSIDCDRSFSNVGSDNNLSAIPRRPLKNLHLKTITGELVHANTLSIQRVVLLFYKHSVIN